METDSQDRKRIQKGAIHRKGKIVKEGERKRYNREKEIQKKEK